MLIQEIFKKIKLKEYITEQELYESLAFNPIITKYKHNEIFAIETYQFDKSIHLE
jgi:hypothetical protein